jgi:hypothetical protein
MVCFKYMTSYTLPEEEKIGIEEEIKENAALFAIDPEELDNDARSKEIMRI